jgi:hypothetical protein
MALTKGERRSGTTVSSIQSRMGKVDAYKGQTGLEIGSAAIGEFLQNEAERRANIEGLQWTANFEIDTRKKITDLSRLHPDDPQAFTEATNSYITEQVEQAPVRFKQKAKQFTSTLAAQKGDVIWTEWNNKANIKAVNDFGLSSQEFIEDAKFNIFKMNPNEHEAYFNNTLKNQMAEKVLENALLFETMPANIQSQLLANGQGPEEYGKMLALNFEEERITSNAIKILEAAAAADKILIDKGVDADQIVGVKNALLLLKDNEKAYLKNPEYDQDRGSEVWADSTMSDREFMLGEVNKVITNFVAENESQKARIKISQKQNQQDRFDLQISLFNNFNTENFDTVESVREWNELNKGSEEQLTSLMEAWEYSKRIKYTAENNAYVEGVETIGGETYGANVNFFPNVTTNEINQKIDNMQQTLKFVNPETKITKSKIKNDLADFHIFQVMKALDPNLTFTSYTDLDLSYVNEQSLEVKNSMLNAFRTVSNKYGVMPERFNTFINDAMSLNPKIAGDLVDLENIAETVLFLSESNNANDIVSSGQAYNFDESANMNFPLLVKLGKKLRKAAASEAKIKKGLTGQELKEYTNKSIEYKERIVESWRSEVTPDSTLMEEKINHIKNHNENTKKGSFLDIGYNINQLTGSNFNVQDYLEEQVKKAFNDGMNIAFGMSDQDPLTGNNEFNVKGFDKDFEVSFKIIMGEIENNFYSMLAGQFGSDYLQTMTPSNLKKETKNIMPFIMKNIESLGYGADENVKGFDLLGWFR